MTQYVPTLGIVVPCYNEEEVLPRTLEALTGELDALVSDGMIGAESFILFVDDGSRDSTWRLIAGYAAADRRVKGLKLAANAGHQNALFAGLMQARASADCTISIDADLQDDTSVIREFLKRYAEGCQIVYGIRNERKTDTAFKRSSAQTFYKLMRLSGVKLRYNHADYRLMSRTALDALSDYREGHLFLRGIVPLLGFKSAEVLYSRKERAAGVTKYPLRKMLAFAFDGVTSFSKAPIKLITGVGLFGLLMSLVAIIYVVASILHGDIVPGWTSIMISVWVIGSLQLIAIGVVGEYIGKIFMEVKRRPRYVVEEFVE
ncbi:MAG: glycosyltransferase family 2 protein [Defluviitaleaceae bacterium]|nr:glycosyltransferase family 2 protein [Defluviitaleaceae bacterium]